MKRIFVSYGEDITADEAMKYASLALRSGQRTGVITFNDGTALAFSDNTKYPSMTIWRKVI